jgi:hypothetical protein
MRVEKQQRQQLPRAAAPRPAAAACHSWPAAGSRSALARQHQRSGSGLGAEQTYEAVAAAAHNLHLKVVQRAVGGDGVVGAHRRRIAVLRPGADVLDAAAVDGQVALRGGADGGIPRAGLPPRHHTAVQPAPRCAAEAERPALLLAEGFSVPGRRCRGDERRVQGGAAEGAAVLGAQSWHWAAGPVGAWRNILPSAPTRSRMPDATRKRYAPALASGGLQAHPQILADGYELLGWSACL